MPRPRLNVQAPIEPCFARRGNTYCFDPQGRLDDAQLASCLEAARWAPCCAGTSPWRFVVAHRQRDIAAWRAVLDALVADERLWAQHAQALIVALCPSMPNDEQVAQWSEYDTGQAVVSLCLQAQSLGLASQQTGRFDTARLRLALSLPAAVRVMSVIALGPPLDASRASEPLRALDALPRERAPLESLVFAGRWDEPWRAPAACGWEARYQETPAEDLPWFHAPLDADIARALDILGLRRGRALDLGCGPGTQAVALAERGFDVVASDISATAVREAQERAQERGVAVEFHVDDILHTVLRGPFDLIVDRGVFHCFTEARDRERFQRSMLSLLAPDGVWLLKCFHRRETRKEGPPGRYDAEDIARLLPEFSLIEHWDTHFDPGSAQDGPQALLCILRRRA